MARYGRNASRTTTLPSGLAVEKSPYLQTFGTLLTEALATLMASYYTVIFPRRRKECKCMPSGNDNANSSR